MQKNVWFKLDLNFIVSKRKRKIHQERKWIEFRDLEKFSAEKDKKSCFVKKAFGKRKKKWIWNYRKANGIKFSTTTTASNRTIVWRWQMICPKDRRWDFIRPHQHQSDQLSCSRRIISSNEQNKKSIISKAQTKRFFPLFACRSLILLAAIASHCNSSTDVSCIFSSSFSFSFRFFHGSCV